jgi:hypothetical protein
MTFSVYDADMAPSSTATENTTTGTTMVFSPTSAVPTTRLAVLLMNWDNVDTTNADDTTFGVVTDSKGNTWIRAAEAQYSAGGTTDGIINGIYYSIITTQIETSDTITLTVASATGTMSRALTLCAFNRDAAKTIAVAGKVYARDAAATSYSVTVSGLDLEEHLWIGHNAHEDSAGATNNADSTSFGGPNGNILQATSPWGTGGGGSANTASRGGYFINTDTTQTYNTTGLENADRVTTLLAFKEVAAVTTTRKLRVVTSPLRW